MNKKLNFWQKRFTLWQISKTIKEEEDLLTKDIISGLSLPDFDKLRNQIDLLEQFHNLRIKMFKMRR